MKRNIARGTLCIAFSDIALARYNTSSNSYYALHKKYYRTFSVTVSPTAAHNNHMVL